MSQDLADFYEQNIMRAGKADSKSKSKTPPEKIIRSGRKAEAKSPRKEIGKLQQTLRTRSKTPSPRVQTPVKNKKSK